MTADSVLSEEVRKILPVLPDPGVGPLSSLHPASFLLFSDRISYSVCSLPSFGPFLWAQTVDGIPFLPLPPRQFFSASVLREPGRELLARFGAECRELLGFSPVAIDGAPLGVAGLFPVRSVRDIEYVLERNSFLEAKGNAGRATRWELNRFRRDHPESRVRPAGPSDFPEVLRLVSDFSRWKRRGAREDLERMMAEDMEAAHHRAVAHCRDWGLFGWVAEEKGRILGIGWYGLSTNRRVLVCFLEARDPECANLGTFLTRGVVEALTGVEWVNIMGGWGLPSVERAKRSRPHALSIPLYSLPFE